MTKRTIIGRNLKYFVKNRPITVHSRAEFEVFCQKPPEFVPYTISLSLLFLHGLDSVQLQEEFPHHGGRLLLRYLVQRGGEAFLYERTLSGGGVHERMQ